MGFTDRQVISNDVDTAHDESVAPVNFDISTYPSDHTLEGICRMWSEGDIVIPPFQREFVWKIRQASLLIESFLLGLPVPSIFLYFSGESQKCWVIDGQQRIMSIVSFFGGNWPSAGSKKRVFRLSLPNVNSRYYNLSYDDLEAVDQRRLKNHAILRAINVRQHKPKKDDTSAYYIFERLNTGGTPLNNQQIRHCIFHGKMVEDLKILNQNASWRKIFGKQKLDAKWKDIELIVRLFGMSELFKAEYESPMKEFLNKVMVQHRDGNTEEWNTFKNKFPALCELIIHQLGEKPFHPRGQLNGSILDSVFSCIINLENNLNLSNIKDNYNKLILNEDYENVTNRHTSNKNSVKKRLELVRKYLL